MYRILLLISTSGLLLGGCVGGPNMTADSDEDGLLDAFEMVIGSDPLSADTDGDGHDDGDEYGAFFDPMDEGDFPYAGDYPRQALPTDGIASTGYEIGEVSHNWSAEDQFGEEIELHKFYGNVIVVELAADW